jgi:hypothetical protein
LNSGAVRAKVKGKRVNIVDTAQRNWTSETRSQNSPGDVRKSGLSCVPRIDERIVNDGTRAFEAFKDDYERASMVRISSIFSMSATAARLEPNGPSFGGLFDRERRSQWRIVKVS